MTESQVRISKPQLGELIAALSTAGYRTIGPQVSDGAIIYGELDSIDQLPIGIQDEQDAGTYRLADSSRDYWFDFVVGPDSLKGFLFPAQEKLLEISQVDGQWHVVEPDVVDEPLAVIGPRSCDLNAMAIQDQVFLGSDYSDPGYQTRREDLFIVAVNCQRAAATCFCHSMGSGPRCEANFDLLLTELADCFVVQVGTEKGQELLNGIDFQTCSAQDVEDANHVSERLLAELHARSEPNHPHPQRSMETEGIHELLMNNLDHPLWQDVGERCLACANCTLVCPTCFCSHVEDATDLVTGSVERQRSWGSCFTSEHSAMSSGSVRQTTAARYRQWLTHKLATWMDQFGSSGCVGCGRCITWCPVGIDITQEISELRARTS